MILPLDIGVSAVKCIGGLPDEYDARFVYTSPTKTIEYHNVASIHHSS